MPGSDTGAFEAAMWSLLGARGVDVLSFESFSEGWATDAVKQLRIDARILSAPYGALPDLAADRFCDRDVVLCWNGTTSGVLIGGGGFHPEPTGRGSFCAMRRRRRLRWHLPYREDSMW